MFITTIPSVAECLAFLSLVGLTGYCFRLRKSKQILQARLSAVESDQNALKKRLDAVEQLQKEELTQDQIDYRDKLQAQYAALFKQIQDKMDQELKEARAETAGLVKKSRAEFEQKLKTEFDSACEKIKFDEIEYKRTITKKRKEFSRKNGKNAKPQRIWRYIDEE